MVARNANVRYPNTSSKPNPIPNTNTATNLVQNWAVHVTLLHTDTAQERVLLFTVKLWRTTFLSFTIRNFAPNHVRFSEHHFLFKKTHIFSFSQSLMLGILLDPHKALYNNHRELLEQLYAVSKHCSELDKYSDKLD